MKKFLYGLFMWVVRLTWGILETAIGFIVFIVFLFMHPEIHYIANTIVVRVHTTIAGGWGFALGAFIFSNSDSVWDRDKFFCHEFGHSWPQLLLMGPLHPFLVSIPSVIRFWIRTYQTGYLTPYDSVWFEGTATRWGMKWFDWGVRHGLWS